MCDPSQFETFKLLRDEIRFEHGQIGQRMNWFVVSQTFLMTPYAISRGGTKAAQLQWFWGILLPIIGMTMALLILVAITAAVHRVRDHRMRMEERRPKDRCRNGEEFLSWGSDGWRFCAILVPQVTPILFACVWAVLLGNTDSSFHFDACAVVAVCVIGIVIIVAANSPEPSPGGTTDETKNGSNDAQNTNNQTAS